MRFYATADWDDRHWTTTLLTALILVSLFSLPDSASAQGRVYWTEPDNSSIQSTGIDGMSPATIARGLYMLEPIEIDADELAGWLYWTDRALGTIARSRSDGRTPEFLIGDPNVLYPPMVGGSLHAPYGLSVDATNGFIYWSEKDLIRRARLDGSDIVDLVTGFAWPQALEVFPEENLMFWTVSGGGTYRARLNGSDIEKISDLGTEYLALSKQARSLYISKDKTIIRFGLDGENQETIVEFDANIHAVGVEEGADRLCWSFNRGLACSALDGTDPAVLMATPRAARGISIDTKSRMVSFSTGPWPARLMRCRHDGSGIEDLIDPILAPVDVSVDPVEGKVYWIDTPIYGPVVVTRSNLDGSSIEDIRITASTGLTFGAVSSVTVDPVSRRLYVGLSAQGSGYIGGFASGPLDGPVDKVVVGSSGLFWVNPIDILVDPVDQVLYYASRELHRIARMSTDGTSHEILVSGIDPRGIAIWDPVAATPGGKIAERRLFWVEHDQKRIRSANLDGTDAIDILTGLSDPAYLKIDSYSGIMMWSDFGSGQIMRANLDGSDMRTIASADSRISGIDFVSSPSAVSLTYPPPLASGLPTSIDLTWINPTPSARSEIQVAAGGSLHDIVLALNTPLTTARFDAPVARSDYYWKVRSVSAAGGPGPWTSWSKFSVGSEGALAVTLSEPADGATGVDVEPALAWQEAPSAAFYHLQVSDTAAFVHPIVDIDSLSAMSMAVGPLDNETTYFWRVAGVGEDGEYTFSQASSFTTVVAAPAAVALVSPNSGEAGVSTLPEFSWNEVDDAISYTLEVASDGGFSAIVESVNLAGETYAADVALTYDTEYFWHVRASNAGGEGPWSETRTFRTSVGTAVETDGPPEAFALHQNYPNPFNPTTSIRFDLPVGGPIRLTVINVLGRTVATLFDAVKPAGRYEVVFDARHLPNGLYMYHLNGVGYQQTRTMTLLR